MECKDQLTNVRKMAAREFGRKGKIVVVMSGKGGVGKTNIALNLSVALARSRKKVALFDADIHLPNVTLLTGRTFSTSPKDASFSNTTLSELAVGEAPHVRIVTPDCVIVRSPESEDRIRTGLFHEMTKLRRTDDYVIVDTPAGLSESLIDFASRADEIVVVMTPEPTSVSDAYALIKILYGLDSGIRFQILINFVRAKAEAEEVFERFSLVVEHFLKADTRFLGYIVEDRHVRAAVHEQRPFYLAYPACRASKCIDRIAKRMLL